MLRVTCTGASGSVAEARAELFFSLSLPLAFKEKGCWGPVVSELIKRGGVVGTWVAARHRVEEREKPSEVVAKAVEARCLWARRVICNALARNHTCDFKQTM